MSIDTSTVKICWEYIYNTTPTIIRTTVLVLEIQGDTFGGGGVYREHMTLVCLLSQAMLNV